MSIDWNTTLNNLLVAGLALLCVLPLVITLAAAAFIFWIGRRTYNELAAPDVNRLEGRFRALQASRPDAPRDQLIQQITNEQAVRGGLIGAITGVGGFITLPIALPIDIVLSLRQQAALVDFIARAYGHTQSGGLEAQARTSLILYGGGKLTETATNLTLKLLLRVIGKSFAKLIPVLGAAVSFAVNYAMMQAVGRMAAGWYGRGGRQT